MNWVTEDCGANIRGLNSGKKIHEFQFHPLEKSWALAATWTDCNDVGEEPCKIYKELYMTKDLGQSWQFLKDYVYDFAWALLRLRTNKVSSVCRKSASSSHMIQLRRATRTSSRRRGVQV